LIDSKTLGGVVLINIMSSKFMTKVFNKTQELGNKVTSLAQAKINTEHIIKDIKTNDEEIKNFLFTLGCYQGESVTLISILSENYVIAVKDARYSIDKDLAEAIII
jgi:Fe2+ transport system protein FeoA